MEAWQIVLLVMAGVLFVLIIVLFSMFLALKRKLKNETKPTEAEKINVLEALGLAGDMTVYGRRENVLVIREKEGIRSTTRWNLNSKAVFNSPYFYLQQNDIVYVEPENKVKTADTAPGNRFISIWSAIITTAGFVLISVYQ